MKKQINPTIKAHLIRSACYVLLLPAVCVIPFALAQRNQRDIDGRSSHRVIPTLKQQSAPKQQAGRSDSYLSHHATTKSAKEQKTQPRSKSSSQGPLGIDCDNAPGIVIHDDGSIENGYSGNPDLVSLVIFADKFTPAIYPSTYTNVCVDFLTFPGGPATQNIDIVIFDDDGPGGSPGTELGSLPVSATTHTDIPNPQFNSFDISSLGIIVNDGSVYIGARWVPPSPTNVFMSSDENGAGFGNGYWFNDADNVWDVIQNAFPGYRAMFIRAVEQLAGLAVTSTDPAVGSVVFTQPTDFVVNVSEPVQVGTLAGSDFTVNGTPANSVDYTSGETTMTFHFDTSPVVDQGEQTMHIDEGAFLSDPDGDPVHEFNGTFRYDATLLQVTDTVPPVGGTFTPPAPGTYTYDVNFNEAVDPASVEISDLQLSGNAGGTVTGVTVLPGNMTAEFTLNISFGGNLTADIAEGAITDQFGNPGAAFNGSYTVEGCPPGQYTITPGTDAIVPGDADIGSHCDDCDTPVTLPFPFQLYDQTYNSVNVSSNGRLDFVVQNEPGGYITSCLPPPPNVGPYDFTVFPTWQDLCTDNTPGNCGGNSCTGCGVFTSVSGNPPNRIFNIEWRAAPYGSGATAPTDNFEVRLYEGDPNLKFEVIYGALDPAFLPSTLQNWVAGVQGNSGAGFFTQDFCNPVGNVPPSNVSKTYEIPPCGTPSPTPTPTPTVTPTPTPSGTPSPTPSPTPRVTPRPRPTPHPRP